MLVPVIGLAAFSLVTPITIAAARRPRLPHPLVPPDDQGLPVGGRRVHRHPRQLRPAAGPGCRRRAAHRLRPHRRRDHSPPAAPRWRRRSPPWPRSSMWIAICFVLSHRVRQPARHEGVRQALRRPDLLLHRHHGVLLGRRRRPILHRHPARPTEQARRHARADAESRRTRFFMGAGLLFSPQGLRFRRRRRHRRRGDHQRCARLPPTGVEERPRHPRLHGRPARRHVPRPVVPRGTSPRHAVRGRHAVGDLAGRQVGVRPDAPPATPCSTRCRPARC